MTEYMLEGRRLMKGMPLIFLSDIMREQMVRESAPMVTNMVLNFFLIAIGAMVILYGGGWLLDKIAEWRKRRKNKIGRAHV